MKQVLGLSASLLANKRLGNCDTVLVSGQRLHLLNITTTRHRTNTQKCFLNNIKFLRIVWYNINQSPNAE